MENERGSVIDDGASHVEQLLNSLSGNLAMAQRLARMFVVMQPDFSGRIDAAVRAREYASLKRAVHEVRGSCALFSASKCRQLAERLERNLENGLEDELESDSAALNEALQALAGELRVFVDKVGGAGN